MAQPGSAEVLGTSGRRFESCCPDHAAPLARASASDPIMTARIYKPRQDRDAVRHRQDQGMDARLRARAAARDRAADGLDQLRRHAPAGAAAVSIPPRRRSPIASATASPTRCPSPTCPCAAPSPTPTISPLSAAIPGLIDSGEFVGWVEEAIPIVSQRAGDDGYRAHSPRRLGRRRPSSRAGAVNALKSALHPSYVLTTVL